MPEHPASDNPMPDEPPARIGATETRASSSPGTDPPTSAKLEAWPGQLVPPLRKHKRFRLIPREEAFFDMFAEDAANVLKGARALDEMVRKFDNVEKRALEIEAIEQVGDEISHRIGMKLNGTFVTPFDREDIHGLIASLDDVLDMIDEVANTFIQYNIDEVPSTARKQAGIVVRQCEALATAFTKLHTFKGLDKHLDEVRRLEGEGDKLARAAVAGLFHEKTKATDIIKWKDIYGLLETTIDRCEDVADVLERIVVKHA